MQYMSMDDLVNFYKFTKHVYNLCQSEQFWCNYVLGDNFYLFKPTNYTVLNKLKLHDCTSKEIFFNTYQLNYALQHQLSLQFIHQWVKDGKLDVLRPYFNKLNSGDLHNMIITVGLTYNIKEILDIYFDIIPFKMLATHISPQSYDYLSDRIHYQVFISGLILNNNLPVIKHIITDKTHIMPTCIYSAIHCYNVPALDFLLSFQPDIDMKQQIEHLYGKRFSPLYEKSNNKHQVDAMIQYLLSNGHYGGKYCIKYLIRTNNIALLDKVSKLEKY